jgi:hypothetical protein
MREDKKLKISEIFFQPRTELRALQPPTEVSERIWVNKKNISKQQQYGPNWKEDSIKTAHDMASRKVPYRDRVA